MVVIFHLTTVSKSDQPFTTHLILQPLYSTLLLLTSVRPSVRPQKQANQPPPPPPFPKAVMSTEAKASSAQPRSSMCTCLSLSLAVFVGSTAGGMHHPPTLPIYVSVKLSPRWRMARGNRVVLDLTRKTPCWSPASVFYEVAWNARAPPCRRQTIFRSRAFHFIAAFPNFFPGKYFFLGSGSRI